MTLDLAGSDTGLPRPPFFTTSFLSGTTNVTNSGTLATLSESGGTGAATYLGTISGPVALYHTDGTTILAGASPNSGMQPANTYSGTTTIASGTLQLGDGTMIGSLGTGAVINNGTLLLNQGVNNNGSGQFTTLNAAISGAGSVSQNGPGTVLLTGANSYAGGTVVDGANGTSQLLFGSAGALPDSVVVRNGGIAGTTYALDQFFLDHVVTDLRGVVALGADSGNALDFSNNTALGLGAAAGECDANRFCRTFTFTGGVTPGTVAPGDGGTATPTYQLGGGNAVLNVQTSLADIADPVGGLQATALTHDNNGYTVLSGTNTYSGGTTINSGVLQFASPDAIPNAGTQTIAIHPYASAAAGYALDQTFLQSIKSGSQGTAALAADSSNNLDFNTPALAQISLGAAPNQSVTYSGTIMPNVGSGSVGTFFLGGGAVQGNGGTLTVSSVLSDTNVARGTNQLVVNPAAFTQGINVSLTNVNTYTGLTRIEGGSLTLGNGTVFGNIPTTSGVVIDNFSSLNFSEPTALSFDRAISGNGNLAQYGPGTVTLTGPVSYTGVSFVFNGTLALGPATSLAASSVVDLFNFNNNPAPPAFDISGAGNQTVQGLIGDATSSVTLGGNRLTIGTVGSPYPTDPFNGGAVPTFAGSVNGTGGLTFQGSSTYVLTGTSSYSGNTAVNSGTLQVDGNIRTSTLTTVASGGALTGIGSVGTLTAVSGSSVQPGNPTAPYGTFTAFGRVAMQAGSTFYANVTAAGQANLLQINGTSSFAGNILVTAAPGTYGPAYKTAIVRVTGGTLSFNGSATVTGPNAAGLAVVQEGDTLYVERSGTPAAPTTPPVLDILSNYKSLQRLADDRVAMMITNRVLANMLLGYNEQINCSDCVTGFGSVGSFSAGFHGRKEITHDLSIVGGAGFAEYRAGGVHVTSAPIIAGVMRYDLTELGASRPFGELGGVVSPGQRVTATRDYGFAGALGQGKGTTTVTGGTLFARLGWVSRFTPQDEAAVAGEIGRGWQRFRGYSESGPPSNPYPLADGGGIDRMNTARLGGQWTHLFVPSVEAQINLGMAHSFGARTGLNGTFSGTALPVTIGDHSWGEYGARVGYRFAQGFVVDAFADGTIGPRPVGATIHGGVAARYAF